jgi:cytochrome P450
MASYAAAVATNGDSHAVIDAHKEMMALTLGIVGKTLFDSNVEHEAAAHRRRAHSRRSSRSTTDSSSRSARLLDRLPLPATLRFRKARSRLDATIYRMIEDRRASGVDRGDLLSMLLFAQDTEGDGSGMSDVQLRDEAMTIFLAGHETTANALTWTWYLLAQHPDVEARFHAEIDSTLGGRLPSADDLPSLPYTRMVLAESMRLYPPAMDPGPTCARAVRGKRVRDSVALDCAPLALTHASRCAVVSGPGAVRPGTVLPRAPGRASEVRLLPVRRRTARVHR